MKHLTFLMYLTGILFCSSNYVMANITGDNSNCIGDLKIYTINVPIGHTSVWSAVNGTVIDLTMNSQAGQIIINSPNPIASGAGTISGILIDSPPFDFNPCIHISAINNDYDYVLSFTRLLMQVD
ncbi:MAG: hypothetical protein H0X62_16540 [Bacteroidetes bacterium]|nr:hypothetical protein [Bacteroidota bacterium]